VNHDDVHQDVFDADDGLAAFAIDLRAAADDAALPAVGGELARLFTDGLPPAGDAAAAATARRPLRRRVAIVLGAGLTLTASGFGAAGALPGPVQRAVADVADVIGIDLPSSADAEDGPTPSPATTRPPRPVAPPSSVPSSVPSWTRPTVPPSTTLPPTSSPHRTPTTGRPADPGSQRSDAPGSGEEHRPQDPGSAPMRAPDATGGARGQQQPTAVPDADRPLAPAPQEPRRATAPDPPGPADPQPQATTEDVVPFPPPRP
jgi:hypothetical protein